MACVERWLFTWMVPLIGVFLLAGCMDGGQDEVVQMGNMKLTSSAFQEGGMIPVKYTCKGQNINPQLILDGVPSDANSIALIVDDPDAPAGDWVHWVLWDIDPVTKEIGENSSTGLEGTTSFKKTGYGGPCPPSGIHRYFFKAYALDKKIGLPTTAGKNELLRAMEGHILAQTQLMGRFGR